MEEQDKKVVVKLEKYQWADEVLAVQKKRQKVWTAIIVGIIIFALGMATMSLLLPYFTINNNHSASHTNLPKIERRYSDTTNDAQVRKFEEVYNLLLKTWYFAKDMEIPQEKLIQNAIEGMLEKNDDQYTSYMNKAELEQFNQAINQSFVGIGVAYFQVDGISIVQKVFNNSPAAKAGVLAGDIFNKVDGKDVKNMPTEEISELVKGEKNTPVVIEFIRDNQPVELEIIRDVVNGTVFAQMYPDNIGYLELSSFGQESAQEVQRDLDYFIQQGAKNLIIDLRGNGGGYLSTLVEIANLFLAKGDIILQQEIQNGSVELTKAQFNQPYKFDKILLLVDQNSASASEVLTAALKENLFNVTVMGVNTFGKGTVQIQAPLIGDNALKVTIAQWLTPKGNKIHKVGIAPDIESRLHEIFYQKISEVIDKNEKLSIQVDQVHPAMTYVHYALDFLGYDISRYDGYYDFKSEAAIKSYQQDKGLAMNGMVDNELILSLISSVNREWNLNKAELDTQLKDALEYLKAQ